MVSQSLKNSIIILLCLLLPFRALGQTQTSTGTFFILKKDHLAPFDGVLFDPFAVGTLLSEKETLSKQFELKLSLELEKQQQKHILEQQNLQISLKTEQDLHLRVVEMKNKEIESLQNIKETSFWEIMMYVGGGVVLGGLTTFMVLCINGVTK